MSDCRAGDGCERVCVCLSCIANVSMVMALMKIKVLEKEREVVRVRKISEEMGGNRLALHHHQHGIIYNGIVKREGRERHREREASHQFIR